MVTKNIAIPSETTDGLNSFVSTRFGRCTAFTIVKIEGDEIKEVKIIENQAVKASSGAGSFAVQTIVEEGANQVIGSLYGPNAARALLYGNIKMYGPSKTPKQTVKGILTEFLNNGLEEVTTPSSPGHIN